MRKKCNCKSLKFPHSPPCIFQQSQLFFIKRQSRSHWKLISRNIFKWKWNLSFFPHCVLSWFWFFWKGNVAILKTWNSKLISNIFFFCLPNPELDSKLISWILKPENSITTLVTLSKTTITFYKYRRFFLNVSSREELSLIFTWYLPSSGPSVSVLWDGF